MSFLFSITFKNRWNKQRFFLPFITLFYFIILIIFFVMSLIDGDWLMFVSGFLTLPVFSFTWTIARKQNKENYKQINKLGEQEKLIKEQRKLSEEQKEMIKKQNQTLNRIEQLNENQFSILKYIKPSVDLLVYENLKQETKKYFKFEEKEGLYIDEYSNNFLKNFLSENIKIDIKNFYDNNYKTTEKENIIEEVKK